MSVVRLRIFAIIFAVIALLLVARDADACFPTFAERALVSTFTDARDAPPVQPCVHDAGLSISPAGPLSIGGQGAWRASSHAISLVSLLALAVTEFKPAGSEMARGKPFLSTDGLHAARGAAEIVPRSVGAAESALSIAARGGKHAGFLKQAQSFTRSQLNRAANSFQRQIELHEAKMANPGNFISEWGSMTPVQQQGLLGHWADEIMNFAEQQSIVQGLMR